MKEERQMSIKQNIKFKDEINFEEDQQDLVDKTASIQSLSLIHI